MLDPPMSFNLENSQTNHQKFWVEGQVNGWTERESKKKVEKEGFDGGTKQKGEWHETKGGPELSKAEE